MWGSGSATKNNDRQVNTPKKPTPKKRMTAAEKRAAGIEVTPRKKAASASTASTSGAASVS